MKFDFTLWQNALDDQNLLQILAHKFCTICRAEGDSLHAFVPGQCGKCSHVA
jgi:hypothetical protein